MAGETLKFKRRFKPMTVEIEGKEEAVHFFETVALTRSVEKQVGETMQSVGGFDRDTTDEEALDVILDTIDKMIVPAKGKKTKASKVLKDLWKAEDIESMDIVDFLNDLFTKRRPT
jgi:hypothetical protein